MFGDLIIKLAKRIIYQRNLKKWKDDRQKKWLAEGRSLEEINKELKNHK